MKTGIMVAWKHIHYVNGAERSSRHRGPQKTNLGWIPAGVCTQRNSIQQLGENERSISSSINYLITVWQRQKTNSSFPFFWNPHPIKFFPPFAASIFWTSRAFSVHELPMHLRTKQHKFLTYMYIFTKSISSGILLNL